MDTPNPFVARSPEAEAIARVFGVALIAMAVVVVLVATLVVVASIRYHARRVGRDPAPGRERRWPETAWTAAPLMLVTALFALSAWGMHVSDPPSSGRDPDVVIVGHRWWWEFRYPSAGLVTANELHLPVGRPLLAEVRSTDVIHDFWVPQLGRKMDATPGHPTRIWLQPSRPGVYQGACAEYCGLQHAWMRILVVAQPPADYEAWLARLRTAPRPTGLAARGQDLFRTRTCVSCHTVGDAGPGPQIAPDLGHLASRTTLAAGALAASRADLARWLAAPQRYKPGTLMPDLKLTQPEIDALVEYLWTP